MNLTKLGTQLIAHEGLKKFPYTDTVGKMTIGVGHNLTDKGLTTSQVMSILSADMADVVNLLNSRLPWFNGLDDVRQRALADLTFDLMEKVFDFPKMLAALASGDWPTASAELLNSTFATQTGKRAKDLASMFLTGQDPR